MTPEDQASFPGLSTDSEQGLPSEYRIPDIAGYQIIKELPRGGQAMVYEAVHLATKTKVALKVLHPDMHHSDRAKRYFEQEVEFASRLHHPNIVTIRDSGVIQGLYYFAMEYVCGEPLIHNLEQGNLPVRAKLTLFKKICDAMAHAHQHGVIHRDLKPSNILVDEHGKPRILDFGLAKSIDFLDSPDDPQEMATLTGELRGTLAYMAPEQADGQPARIDVRTDIYALGVILYRMLTRVFPYDVSGSAFSTLQAIRSVDPVRPKQVIKKLDSDIEAIVLKCLEKTPERRYQSAADLRDEISRWMQGLPILARSVSSLYLMRKVVLRHRLTSAVILLLLVILLEFGFVYFHVYTSLCKETTQRLTTVDSLNSTNRDYHNLARQVAFVHLLDWWHRDQLPAPEITQLGPSTREGIARRFLADPTPLLKKIPELRAKLADEPFFAEFVIAESYMKINNPQKAYQSYRACLNQALPSERDPLIKTRIHLRVADLAQRIGSWDLPRTPMAN